MPVPADPRRPYKAIAAFILTFAGLVFQAVVDKGDGSITTREWVVIVIGSLLTTATVYGITNPARPGVAARHDDTGRNASGA